MQKQPSNKQQLLSSWLGSTRRWSLVHEKWHMKTDHRTSTQISTRVMGHALAAEDPAGAMVCDWAQGDGSVTLDNPCQYSWH